MGLHEIRLGCSQTERSQPPTFLSGITASRARDLAKLAEQRISLLADIYARDLPLDSVKYHLSNHTSLWAYTRVIQVDHWMSLLRSPYV